MIKRKPLDEDEFRSWELNLMKDVLLHVIFQAFAFVVALVRHIDMKQGFASSLQLSILLGADAKLAQRNLEVEQIAC